METRPEIMRRDGYSIIENVVVGPLYGLCVRPSGEIAREASRYPKRIFLETTSDRPARASAKSIIGLMAMEVQHGNTIRIFVEGLDSEAERVALRLYSGITTLSSEDYLGFMEFDKFEQ